MNFANTIVVESMLRTFSTGVIPCPAGAISADVKYCRLCMYCIRGRQILPLVYVLYPRTSNTAACVCIVSADVKYCRLCMYCIGGRQILPLVYVLYPRTSNTAACVCIVSADVKYCRLCMYCIRGRQILPLVYVLYPRTSILPLVYVLYPRTSNTAACVCIVSADVKYCRLCMY